MALQLGALRAALVDAGASDETASKAAEEVAGYTHELSDVKRDLHLLKWMIGTNFAVSLGILAKLLIH
jgi:hypothetical protein